MTDTYRLLKSPLPGNVLELPQDLIYRLKLAEKNFVRLACGSAHTMVQIRSRQPVRGLNHIRLTPRVFDALHLPPGINLAVTAKSPQEIRLGPVIGILIFQSHITKNRLYFYKSFAEVSKDSGLLFLFSGRAMDDKTRTISGFYYDRWAKTWKYARLPFPDAVIDRCYPSVRRYQNILTSVIGPGRIFNKKTNISKWDFHTILTDDPELKKHVPDTIVLNDINSLKNFLYKYRLVFAKPVGGMQGHGIVYISQQPDEKIKCQYTKNKLNKEETVSAPEEILPLLEKAAGRKRPYVIQQAIGRNTYKGRPFCFRVMVMKNHEGIWRVPGIFAKTTSENGILTNYSSGAKFILIDDLLKGLTSQLPYSKKELLDSLKEIAVNAAITLEKRFKPLGEIGMDVILSPDGKLWLIEANGNPGRIPPSARKEYPLYHDHVVRLPFNYACFLAGFGNKVRAISGLS